MRDMDEQAPSERDKAIYMQWEGSKKTLRGLARQFETSVTEISLAIDRCLPVFNSKNQMMAYKREIQKLEDVGTHYYAKAMEGDLDSGHLYARINERYCAMQGWTSVNIRLDPYATQVQERSTSFERIREAVYAVARGRQPNGGNGAALVPPLEPSTDDRNGSDSEQSSTPMKDAT